MKPLLIALLIRKFKVCYIRKLNRFILPNPISVEMSAMRRFTINRIARAVSYNQNRQQNRVRLFEFGLRFMPDEKPNLAYAKEQVLRQ